MIVLSEVHRIYRETQRQTGGKVALQENSALWVLRHEAWVMLLQETTSPFDGTETTSPFDGTVGMPGQHRQLLGLPVRLTIDDDADTPAVQLVMEPVFTPRKVTR